MTPPGKKGSGICGINSVTDPNNPNYGKWDHEMAPDQLKPELFAPTEIRKLDSTVLSTNSCFVLAIAQMNGMVSESIPSGKISGLSNT